MIEALLHATGLYIYEVTHSDEAGIQNTYLRVFSSSAKNAHVCSVTPGTCASIEDFQNIVRRLQQEVSPSNVTSSMRVSETRARQETESSVGDHPLLPYADHLSQQVVCDMTSTMQATKKLDDGSLLEVVINSYADRWLVLITQLGKVGNLVRNSPTLRPHVLLRPETPSIDSGNNSGHNAFIRDFRSVVA
jgi:hypothetical protein